MLSLIGMSDLFRTIVTVLGLVAFVLLWFWAYSSRTKKDFSEAEMLPFMDEDGHRDVEKEEHT